MLFINNHDLLSSTYLPDIHTGFKWVIFTCSSTSANWKTAIVHLTEVDGFLRVNKKYLKENLKSTNIDGM